MTYSYFLIFLRRKQTQKDRPVSMVAQLERKGGSAGSFYLLEGLFSSVSSDVVVEGGRPGEGTTTVATLERPVTGVGDHVVPQLRRL